MIYLPATAKAFAEKRDSKYLNGNLRVCRHL